MKEHKYVKETPVTIYDNDGYPSMMLKLENTAPSKDLADPIFIVKGVEYDSVFLSRFLNSEVSGHIVSLPFLDPLAMISMDEAIRRMREKGRGWHVMTNCEWRYIADTAEPDVHGNTDFGKYHGGAESGIKGDFGRTLAGSGPESWFHNKSKETGIADIIGDTWKIITGIRLKNGILEYMMNNDAAAPDADLSEDSEEFSRVIIDGRPVMIGMNESGNLAITTESVDGFDCVERMDVSVDLKEIPQILRDLGIITDNMAESREWFAADAELYEAIPFVGGCYYNTSNAGSSALYLFNVRSFVYTSIGFFSALLGNPAIR